MSDDARSTPPSESDGASVPVQKRRRLPMDEIDRERVRDADRRAAPLMAQQILDSYLGDDDSGAPPTSVTVASDGTIFIHVFVDEEDELDEGF